MARTSANPKKFVVSCRVTPKEMEMLQDKAEECGLSITMLLRECLNLMDLAGQQRTQLRA